MADRISHDQNFKNLILDYPREALAFFAPAEAPAAEDVVEIIPVRQEQQQQQLGEPYRELDAPLLVKWQDGHRTDSLFVLEVETEERRFSLHRLVHYCVDLAALYPKHRVVPVVIFLRGAEAAPRRLSLATDGDKYFPFKYLTCELSAMPFERWQDSDNLVARLNLPNMQHTPEQKVEVYAKALNGLLTLEPDWNKRSKYIDFIDIYAGLTDNEVQRFQQQYTEASETMIGIVQRARDEGMQQGMEQGRVEGRVEGWVEGERTVLQRLLQQRFGQLPPEIVARLAQASRSDLETWADDVLNAGTLDDVFGRS